MSQHFRNTLGGAVEPFEPIESGHVRMYTCGPTVYAPAHIGNFRSFVFADLVRRALLFSGLSVSWVMNITDVDDKIIRDAGRAGIPIGELTAGYTAAFLEDLARLVEFEHLHIADIRFDIDCRPLSLELLEQDVSAHGSKTLRQHAYR
jgi:cysteinyl-tRNA synthetase